MRILWLPKSTVEEDVREKLGRLTLDGFEEYQ